MSKPGKQAKTPKAKQTSAEKEAALQARIDAIVERARNAAESCAYAGGDVLFDPRPLMAKLGKRGRKL